MGRVLTYGQLAADTRSRLESHYSEGEARAMTRIIFERLKGFSQTDMLLKADEEASDYIAGKVEAVVKRLLDDEPIQYIFGIADFYGLEFKVTPDVLIPRPETAELVDMIVSDADGKSDLAVLDLCTGSGCIACALARNLPFAGVSAVDISEKALEIAEFNAKSLKVRVNFSNADVRSLNPSPDSYNIIVSNPPYITDSEKSEMEQNVLAHEPALALFVPDSDPLEFYRPIAEFASKSLKKGGALYLEINPLFADAVKNELKAAGFDEIDIVRDSAARNRFVRARL
ncbi:MAG: peptide chain release factor N(5)-glutamine methyltransferase [Paramuribaculum sp.]|nr:peptide chain release factor N(5)-glutamine methyltransferase [Paramuribaculum sp.]